jgi:hypothetical protein
MLSIIVSLHSVKDSLISYAYKLCVILQSTIMPSVVAEFQNVRNASLFSDAYNVQEDLSVILQSAIMPSVIAKFQNVRNALLISDAYKVQEDLLKMFYAEIKKAFCVNKKSVASWLILNVIERRR